MRKLEGYMKGVNFGGWLSQCDHTKDRYDTFITEADFENVKNMGFDHIRVPVDYELIETEDGQRKEEGYQYIDFAIAMCRKYGLYMILDLHRTPGYSFDPNHNKNGLFDDEKLQKRFFKIWEDLAKRYADENADMLAFELLNEVTKKEYQPKWNEMIATCIEMIRSYSDEMKVIVGGYNNNSVEAIEALDQPYDENVIYTFHFYEPLLFTHQGAPWIATMDTEFRCPFEMTYGEYEKLSAKLLCQAYSDFTVYDQNKRIDEIYFENLLSQAVKVADERNVCLYCGEFGVIDRADRAEADKWFKIFRKVMKKYEIGSAVWNYKQMDFEIERKQYV